MPEIDKSILFREHLTSSVVLVAHDDSYLSAHVLLRAADELFRAWYMKKDREFRLDYRKITKEDANPDGLIKLREKYRLIRLSSVQDLEIDPDELRRLNEMTLIRLIVGYQMLFGSGGAAMECYARWMFIADPSAIRWEILPGAEPLRRTADAASALGAHDKRQMLRAFLYRENVLPRDDLELFARVCL